MPIILRLTLGTSDISLQQLRNLEQGDVVFVTHPFLNGSRQLLLRTDPLQGLHGQSWSLAVHLDDHFLTVTGSPTLMNDTPSSSPLEADAPMSEPGDAAGEASVDRIPVRLSFDLGNKVLAWADLANLSPGDTLPLDRPAEQYVSIRANGALIGRGHLVELDNRLGVSIDELHAPRQASIAETHDKDLA